MTYFDITRALNANSPHWDGDREFEFNQKHDSGFSTGDIAASLHTATHIDAPAHCIEGGASIDDIPLEKLIGPAEVLRPRGTGKIITAADLAHIRADTTRLLLKNSSNRFLCRDAAAFILDKNIQLIATEAMSIAESSSELEIHRLLLSVNTIIIESVDLSSVNIGLYNMISLPLKISGADAAWTRTILKPIN